MRQPKAANAQHPRPAPLDSGSQASYFVGMSSVLREMKRRLAASKAAFIEPCLPTLAHEPPAGPRWLHEIKHDGYRLQARRDANGVTLVTRNGYVWTDRCPAIADGVAALACRSCIIDGEVVVIDGSGLAVFDKLRYGARVKTDVLLFAFDLVELDGSDLRRHPIEDRKARLDRLVQACLSIRYVEHLEGDGSLIFEHASALGCEGIVSKRVGSRYVSGRSRDWIKVKNPAAPAARRLEEEDWRR